MPPRKRLGQLLTELGVIDEHQLQSALGHQKQWGGKLGSVLVQKGFCKEPDVVAALSKHLGMPQVKLAEAKIDPRAIKFVSKQIAEKLHVFPYELSGTGRAEVVTIAMSDPTDLSAVDQLAFHTGKRIKPMLAGDSEIIQAIQAHYGGGDEKKPLTTPAAGVAPAKPITGQMAPVPPAPAAAQQFPRRIDAPNPAGGSPRAAPYIPPPIPAAAAKPEQKLEEIEPDETMSVASPPPPPAEPVELPEDDGEAMPLEPIAAHSQFGDEVAGQEDVDGSGSAADAVEGLESASVKHEGVEEANQMEGLEPIAAHSQEPAPEGGWGADAAPAAGGWGAETAPAAWEQPAETAAVPAGWTEEPADAGWTADAHDEQLPMDAIIGTAETDSVPEAAGWETEQPQTPAAAVSESPSTEEFAALPTEEAAVAPEQPETVESAEAPDAWASSEDPLAAAGESAPPSWGESAPQESSWSAPAAEPAAAEEPPAEEPPAEEPPAEEPPAEEPPAEEPPAEDRPITDKFATEAQQPASAETEAPPEWGEPEEQPAEAAAEESATAESTVPAEEPAAAASEEMGEAPATTEEMGAAADESAVAPEETSFASEDAGAPPEEFAAAPEETAGSFEETAAAAEGSAAPFEEPAAPEEDAAPPEERPAAGEEEAGTQPEEAAAPEEDTGYAAEPQEPTAGEEQLPTEEFSEGASELKLEGWIAPPPEPEPQGAGWFGQALESTTPLSTADLGTLASIGVDPNDGVAALRLLAAVVRVLNRHQAIDPTEIALEIHESRSAAAAEHAAAHSPDGEPQQETSETEQVPAEPAET